MIRLILNVSTFFSFFVARFQCNNVSNSKRTWFGRCNWFYVSLVNDLSNEMHLRIFDWHLNGLNSSHSIFTAIHFSLINYRCGVSFLSANKEHFSCWNWLFVSLKWHRKMSLIDEAFWSNHERNKRKVKRKKERQDALGSDEIHVKYHRVISNV